MRLLPQGDNGLYLYIYIFYCACIFNSFEICAQIQACIGSVPVYSIPLGYMHKFCILFFWLVWDSCLHIQFLEDMCTSCVPSLLTCIGSMPACSISLRYVHKFCTFSSGFYGIHACIFNSQRICAQVALVF